MSLTSCGSRNPEVIVIEIVEAYKDWQPPMNARKAVTAVVSSVPDEYLIGLRRIIMTNATGLNRSRRRKKTKHRGQTRRSKEALGNYHQSWQGQPAYIEIFVDNIIAQCPRAMRMPPIRDALFSDVVFHEIGHHVHMTRAREFREREEVADDWALRIGRHYFRTMAWYLIPLVNLFGLKLFGRKINLYRSSRA